MKNTATPLLESVERHDLFMVLPGWSETSRQIDIEGSAFDIGETVLAYLGIETPIGFGRNLLREESVFNERQNTLALFTFWSQKFYEF